MKFLNHLEIETDMFLKMSISLSSTIKNYIDIYLKCIYRNR